MFQFVKKHGNDSEYIQDLESITKFMKENEDKINDEKIASQP